MRSEWWLAFPGEEGLTAIGCSMGASHPCGPLRAVCPHQLTFALLAHLGHSGPPEWHELAGALLERLPAH